MLQDLQTATSSSTAVYPSTKTGPPDHDLLGRKLKGKELMDRVRCHESGILLLPADVKDRPLQ